MPRKTETITSAQAAQLVQRLRALGYRAQDLAAIIVAGRRRADIATALIDRQRQARKA